MPAKEHAGVLLDQPAVRRKPPEPPQPPPAPPPSTTSVEILRRAVSLLFCLDLLLAVAHLLWPDYRWGQGRGSYFDLGAGTTLASWLVSMQLATVGIFLLAEARRVWRAPGPRRGSAGWLVAAAAAAAALSLTAATNLHRRLHLVAWPADDLFSVLGIWAAASVALAAGGLLLLRHLDLSLRAIKLATIWQVAWATSLLAGVFGAFDIRWAWELSPVLLAGLGKLLGATALLGAVGEAVLGGASARIAFSFPAAVLAPERATRRQRLALLTAVAGACATIVLLEVLFFRLLTIFSGHFEALSVISVAVLGTAAGGLAGWRAGRRNTLAPLVVAALLLPAALLVAVGATVAGDIPPLPLAAIVALPFACCGTLVTAILTRLRSHVVYAMDLLGAAAGALLVGPLLGHLREEGIVLALCAVGWLLAASLLAGEPLRPRRRPLLIAILIGAALFAGLAEANRHGGWLNVIRVKVQRQYPEAEVIVSRSSFVGRYDVLRRSPTHRSLTAYENGRTIDTIRRRPPEGYRIDPRIPHNLIDDPSVLIIGLSGDGVTKTARAISSDVHGVEINPVVVRAQRGVLREYNGGSYEGIEVSVLDARSFLRQSNRRYDIITLMNAHSALGGARGRGPATEYLHTLEAFRDYLDHLSDRGVIIVEEPMPEPASEPPVWKQVLTMRRALLDRGAEDPAAHLFVFQWKTRRNNYAQILLKKTPFTQAEVGAVETWLSEVDDLERIEHRRGRRLGPIDARTTVLHTPRRQLPTLVSRVARGEVDPSLRAAYNLVEVTDDRPFLFDVDSTHATARRHYGTTLALALLVAGGVLLLRRRAPERLALGGLLALVALTGLGYLMIETVLIQRFEIFLGSPTLTFATVLGALLFFSGLGSLLSAALGQRGLILALVGLLVALGLAIESVPSLLEACSNLPGWGRVTLTVALIAPLGVVLGVPFPYLMRLAAHRLSASAVALLFVANAAASAAGVPLAIIVGMRWGFDRVLGLTLLLYAGVALSVWLAGGTRRPRVLLGAGALLAALLLVPWAPAAGTASPAGAPAGSWEVYGLDIGHSEFRESRVLAGGRHSERIPAAWLFWLARGPEGVVLVDTGFSGAEVVRRWRIEDHASPVERLAAVGVSPPQVTDVILTHAHWDHIGGLAPYRLATVWMQRAEFDHAVAAVGPERPEAHGIRWSDVRRLLEIEREGRLRLVDGVATVAPGIEIRKAGSHTPGIQYAVVRGEDGPVVLAGDTSYFYFNHQRRHPTGAARDGAAELAAFEAMTLRVASPFLLLPGHDPRVLRWFPSSRQGIARISLRARGE